ncbi:MAG: helix-turn-helix transcriptional regulator [Clostridia bacterium]|nr:helix-turn-helix transcriptional regulator [Clostridia bacterium]
MIVKYKNEIDKNIENANLSVLEGGRATIDKGWHGDDIMSIFNRLYYIIEGNGAFLESEGEKIAMLPGNIYLIPSHYKYKYWCEGKVEKVFFHINIKRHDGYDAFATFDRIGEIFDPKRIERVSSLFDGESQASYFALKGELLGTVAAIAEKYEFKMDVGDGKEHSAVLRAAERYIQNHLSLKLTRKIVAESCKVSEGKLGAHFKNELGVSVGKYIDDLVFMEAIRRLIYTDDPLGNISDDLGFCDQFYFSRRFNEIYKMSPLKYRKKMQSIR